MEIDIQAHTQSNYRGLYTGSVGAPAPSPSPTPTPQASLPQTAAPPINQSLQNLIKNDARARWCQSLKKPLFGFAAGIALFNSTQNRDQIREIVTLVNSRLLQGHDVLVYNCAAHMDYLNCRKELMDLTVSFYGVTSPISLIRKGIWNIVKAKDIAKYYIRKHNISKILARLNNTNYSHFLDRRFPLDADRVLYVIDNQVNAGTITTQERDEIVDFFNVFLPVIMLAHGK